MTSTKVRRTGRLSRRRILRAALAVIDREGLDALSMRKLGAALGVEAMSLYHHVDNKDALLDGVVELLTEEIEVPPVGTEPWPDAIRSVLRSYRSVAHAHPAAFPLLVLRPLVAPKAIARARSSIDLLVHAGFDERAAVLAFRALASYAGGFVLEELTGRPPHFTVGDRDAEFEFGLDALLVGLRVKLNGAG